MNPDKDHLKAITERQQVLDPGWFILQHIVYDHQVTCTRDGCCRGVGSRDDVGPHRLHDLLLVPQVILKRPRYRNRYPLSLLLPPLARSRH
jgi:hypothetical protein